MGPTRRVSVAEFEAIFESVRNWGRWGIDDQIGTMNYVTPGTVREAAALVRSGRRVSMAIPINKVSGPDNPQQASLFVIQGHDVPIDASKVCPRVPTQAGAGGDRCEARECHQRQSCWSWFARWPSLRCCER
jgi:hypothetical protein